MATMNRHHSEGYEELLAIKRSQSAKMCLMKRHRRSVGNETTRMKYQQWKGHDELLEMLITKNRGQQNNHDEVTATKRSRWIIGKERATRNERDTMNCWQWNNHKESWKVHDELPKMKQPQGTVSNETTSMKWRQRGDHDELSVNRGHDKSQ